MIKIFLLVLMTTVLVGCTPLAPKDCRKAHALDSCHYDRSGKVSDNDIYGEQASGIKKIWMLHLPLPMLGTVNDVMYI